MSKVKAAQGIWSTFAKAVGIGGRGSLSVARAIPKVASAAKNFTIAGAITGAGYLGYSAYTAIAAVIGGPAAAALAITAAVGLVSWMAFGSDSKITKLALGLGTVATIGAFLDQKMGLGILSAPTAEAK